MRDERESHCPPTDVDVWVMVLRFGVFTDAAHGVDSVEETWKLDGPSQGPFGTLPAVQLGQLHVHLFVRQQGHATTVYRRCVPNQIVVAGALIADATLLVAQRNRPPELAGLWELPGGKVAPGESETAALRRELDEELGAEVTVGARVGADVPLSGQLTLRAFLVTQTGGSVQPREHRALRWVTADDLETLDWVPADRAWLPDLAAALRWR